MTTILNGDGGQLKTSVKTSGTRTLCLRYRLGVILLATWRCDLLQVGLRKAEDVGLTGSALTSLRYDPVCSFRLVGHWERAFARRW